MKKLKKYHLIRKIKIFAAIAAIGIFITSGVLIWTGVSAVGFVASKVNEFRALPSVDALKCWTKAQSLMAVEPWFNQPALENFKNLKIACLEEIPTFCEGEECSQIKQTTNSNGGNFI